MTELTKVTDILRDAEAEVRQLLVSCAGRGDYDAAGMLADVARQLCQLAEQMASHNGTAGPVADALGRGNTSLATLAAPVQRPTRIATSQQLPARRAPKKRRKAKLASDYPKFSRDCDELVKIGWSKKHKAEYRHKAPKLVVYLVAEALQRKGANGERFAFEELLPIRDKDGMEVPSYQAYLVLAWLRKENLIERHGRQGYSLSPATDLTRAVKECWEQLPKS